MRKIELFMKKYAFLCLLAVIAFVQTGCVFHGNTPTPDCLYHAKTIYLEVKQNEWQYDAENQQFYTHFDVPEITANIYNYGNYSLHREYNTGTADVYQVALPQSLYLWEEVTNADSTTTIVYYQQLVDYRIGPGYVEIQVTNSDYFYGDYTPDAMLFHLQLTY